MKARGYQSYIWVYILGAILMFANSMFWHNDPLFHLCLLVLHSILFYKGMHIFLCYRRTFNRYPCPEAERRVFTKTYHPFRVRVALFWLAFIVLCIIGKFVLHLERQYFYSCTFLFLFLDRYFVNVVCLLQKFCDPKGSTVLCCCGCPCRGWDLLMIHTPLLFALEFQWATEAIFNLLVSILALFSFLQWETQKYHLVEVRKKCTNACDLKFCKEHRSKKTETHRLI